MSTAKWVATASVLALSIAAVVYFSSTDTSQPPAVTADASNSTPQQRPQPNEAYSTDVSAPTTAGTLPPGGRDDTRDNDAVRQQVKVSAWQALDDVPAQYDELADDGADRRFIEYSELVGKAFRIGDVINVNIPQLSESIPSEVVAIRSLPNGGYDVTSQFIGDDGQAYVVTLTSGENALYATIDTPSDTYFVQGHNDEGWIISGKEQSSLITWDKPDHIVPPVAIAPPPEQE
ncbi:hypothetical protein [Corallincola spongiicola]|uniref:Secreted protein n=1 Tax=Corallincola spongiicola TaxID=2520508 RepID=A0ABY1WLQ0_9GAMM|nr:hypothetical protein [Corallincola spongiicola]TAA41835.1 hypothetical protein EXY25_16505 [Corallincola spongiicola]